MTRTVKESGIKLKSILQGGCGHGFVDDSIKSEIEDVKELFKDTRFRLTILTITESVAQFA